MKYNKHNIQQNKQTKKRKNLTTLSHIITLYVCLYACLSARWDGCDNRLQIFRVTAQRHRDGFISKNSGEGAAERKIVIFAFYGPYRLSACGLAVGNVVIGA